MRSGVWLLRLERPVPTHGHPEGLCPMAGAPHAAGHWEETSGRGELRQEIAGQGKATGRGVEEPESAPSPLHGTLPHGWPCWAQRGDAYKEPWSALGMGGCPCAGLAGCVCVWWWGGLSPYWTNASPWPCPCGAQCCWNPAPQAPSRRYQSVARETPATRTRGSLCFAQCQKRQGSLPPVPATRGWKGAAGYRKLTVLRPLHAWPLLGFIPGSRVPPSGQSRGPQEPMRPPGSCQPSAQGRWEEDSQPCRFSLTFPGHRMEPGTESDTAYPRSRSLPLISI